MNHQRSSFDRSHGHKTTFNVGEVVPVLCEEVLPGDTFSITTSKVARMFLLLMNL
nr:major head protein [Microvirus sp.]